MRFKPKREQQSLVTDPVDLELSINEDNLNKELIDQPLKFRKWSRFEVEAAKALRLAELKLEHAKAKAYMNVKKQGGKMTVKDLEAAVALDAEVVSAQNNVLEAEEIHSDMKTAVKAFLQRHDALKDLAANRRKEIID